LSPNFFPNTGDESVQAVPLTVGDTQGSDVIFHQNNTNKRFDAEIRTGAGTWQRLNVDTNVEVPLLYAGAFSAVTDPTSGDTYVVYQNNKGTVIDSDDEIRLKVRFKNETFFRTLTNPLAATAFGYHDVAIAIDSRTGYLYIAYAERTTSVPSSAILRYVRSGISTYDPVWKQNITSAIAQSWTQPLTLDRQSGSFTATGDFHGVTMNSVSGGRLFVSAVDNNSLAVKLQGVTINDLTPFGP